MQKSQTSSPAGGFGVQDVLFILFKHKWMILLFTLLGLGAAAALYVKQEPAYQSESKLLIRYVLAKGSVDPYEAMSSPGGGGKGMGDQIINTEIEILYSVDLLLGVAEAVGVDRLLPEAAGSATTVDAAGVIRAGLVVTPGFSPSIVYVNFSHRDPRLAREVLTHLLERYFKRHLEIHRSVSEFDQVAKQVEDAKSRLREKETALDDLRKQTGIMSLSDATAALTAQRNKTQEDLLKARADLAERMASLRELEKDALEGELEAEQDRAKRITEAGETPSGEAPPPGVVTEYRSIGELIGFLQKRELELRVKFRPGNRLLTLNREQLSTNEARRSELEQRYPALTSQLEGNLSDPANPRARWITEKAGLAAVHAKIDVLNAHLKEIGEQFSREYAVGAKVESLQREKEMLDVEYRTLETKLKSARAETTLDPSRMPNITIVQQPTEPVKTIDEKMRKLVIGVAAGGLALGLALAFLIELVFNRKIERPIEIRARLQLPLLLSIPFIRRGERGGMLLSRNPNSPRIGMNDADWVPADGQLAAVPPGVNSSHFILPYSETIRDRIIFNFEVNNVIHKPKLVAVTGMSDGAGASTIAAGLAKSFAEIRGVKVLLVDLSSFHPQENPLFGEIPRHSLPTALSMAKDAGFRERPQNLYYANAPSRRDEGGSAFTPLHLHEMMPLLHASEYDYIIFDMPPIDQTSRTLTMAGLMDKVLLVLDAENTSRDGLKWGYSELTKNRADVSCIFNKTRSHGPSWLIGGN